MSLCAGIILATHLTTSVMATGQDGCTERAKVEKGKAKNYGTGFNYDRFNLKSSGESSSDRSTVTERPRRSPRPSAKKATPPGRPQTPPNPEQARKHETILNLAGDFIQAQRQARAYLLEKTGKFDKSRLRQVLRTYPGLSPRPGVPPATESCAIVQVLSPDKNSVQAEFG